MKNSPSGQNIKRYFLIPFYKPKFIKWILFFSYCCLISFVSSAQYDHIAFRHLTIDDGLSNSRIHSILKDSRGFIWIGTAEGLNQYDGYSFIQFRNDPKQENTLSNNDITDIFEDSNKRIWIGTRSGLNIYDRESNTFFTFKDTIDDVNLSSIVVNKIGEDSDGIIWISGYPGFFKINMTTEKIINYLPDPNNPNSIVQDRTAGQFFTNDGKIWIGHDGSGISEFDINNETFVNYRFEDSDLDDTRILRYNAVREILPYNHNKLLIGAYGGLLIFNKDTKSFKRCVIKGYEFQAISAMVPDIDPSRIWISTSGTGLYLLNPQTEKFQHWKASPENLLGISEMSLSSLYLDDQGLLWVGSSRKGIDILDTKNPFQNYQSSNSWLSSNLISCIFEDHRGNIWVGTSGDGLSILNNQKQHNELRNSRFGRFSHDLYVSCIAEDNHGNIWLGTSGDGLFKYNPVTGEYRIFKRIPMDTTSLSHNVIYSIEKMPNGQLLVGTYLDYCLLNPETGKFQRGPSGSTKAILSEKPGAAWFGFERYGLFYVNPKDDIIIQFKYHEDDSLSISSNTIQTIFMDSDSIVWIGTNNGLNKYNRKDRNFTRFSTYDGLSNNSVVGILEDNDGNLWISTSRGLSKFNKDTYSFNNYYSEDGLQSNQFTQGAYLKSSDGLLYFGGVNGLTVFDPDKVIPRKTLPEVAITGFYLFNQPVPLKTDQNVEYPYQLLLDKPIHLTESINLRYREKIFSVDFSALDYVNPGKIQYAFMLNGFEDHWNYTNSNKRFTTYTNLNPGNYTFMVKATNSDGVWNETPTTLSIRVDPPPWKTWWAYMIYGLIFLSIFYMYNRSHQKSLIKKQKELEKERFLNEKLNRADKLKDEFLANTSHELRTPLTGIIGITESLQDGVAGEPSSEMKSNLSLIISSAKRLSSLVNSILDFSKLKTHELQLSIKPIDLRTVTDVVIQISLPLIKGKPVTLTNEIDPSTSLVEADEERLYQILHNLVGNAIKFTGKGGIRILAVEKQDVVEVGIIDTGIGIPKNKIEDIFKSFEQVDASMTREHGGTGLGLTITKQLVELHGGNIWIESEMDRGTRVFFTLPRSNEKKRRIRNQEVLSKVAESVTVEEDEEKKAIEEQILPADSRFNILIVDDEPINQKVLSNHLSRNNFKILHAMNGQEALDVLDQEKLDLILLDIMMPKMSGYEVCREIRKRFLPSELPIIMITAKNQIMDLVEGLDSGANDYLAKPFSRNELLARLKTHLNLYNINTAYLRFIPKEFIRALGHENIIDVKLGDHVKDEMTILFSDIRSFTTITENLNAEESFELLNEFLKQISPAISRNNGFIDKYIGDAVMALFHIKAEDAIKAAIDAQRNLANYNKERKSKRKDKVNIGIGIHTGPLMMGTIGVKDRMDGTVISDAVNLASRLEELNKHYGTTLIVSQDTINKIENLENYNYRFLSHVMVKGKEKPIRIYEIFDGDDDKIKSMKLKTLPLFNEGINEYYNRRFTKASVKFQEVLDMFPEDRTTQIFLAQSAKYMVKGVPDDWDGVDVVDNVF